MDIKRTIRDLIEEKHSLESAIAALERVERGAVEPGTEIPGIRRRGRTSMTTAERRQVSERMRRYWESRRKQRASNGVTSPAGAKNDSVH